MTSEPEGRRPGEGQDERDERPTLTRTAELLGLLLKVPKDEADQVHRVHQEAAQAKS